MARQSPHPERAVRRASGLRPVGALLLLLQLSAAVALPIADATLRSAAAGAGPHFESVASGDCAPHHDDLFCQLCRAINLAADTTVDTGLPRLDAAVLCVPVPDSGRPDVSGLQLTGPLGPRAPPIRA
jgi:hypothetical protein